jgi:hypothetical protein
MKRKSKAVSITVLLSFLIFAHTGFNVYSMTNEEMVARFEEMANKIEAQQKQIEELTTTIRSLQGDSVNETNKSSNPQPAAMVTTREEVKQVVADYFEENNPLPKWLRGLEYGGDFRLRYEGILNRTGGDDRHRTRFRLRLNIAKQLNDEIDFIVRFATGTGNTITSSNQSFDNAFEKKDFWIDRAYAIYRPTFFPGMELVGGKFKNPFVHTDMVWDSDLNQEGAYEHYQFKLTPNFQPFITLSQMAIYENNFERDASLMAYQIGYDWNLGKTKWTVAATYYDYINLEDSQLVQDGLAHGNTTKTRGSEEGLASDFDLVNVTSFWKTQLFGLPLTVFSDFVRNIASTNDSNDYGYAFGGTLGMTKNRGDWTFGYKYARIEPDATVGAFNDANFGFSNRRGSKIWLKYQLLQKVQLATAVYITDSVHGPEDEITDIVLDLLLKF